jgi:flagellar protein FlbD
MIEVTRLNGKKYWVNPHQIESMEENPDVTITFLSGKTVVVKETPDEILNKIIAYRRCLGVNKQEL